ncbi:MAG: hypothetical protein II574_06065 [Ruminococcus sp.]|nr:hypothetical protein [Ruminococcus sp.]
MKKTILIAAMALISMIAVSCGNADENKESPTPAAQSAQSQTSEVNKGEYSQIPQSAEKALSVASKHASKAYAQDGDRSYGYKCTKKVNGSECYCFSVFDKTDENTHHVADIAVEAGGSKVFACDDGKTEFKAVEAANTTKGFSAAK